MKKKKKILCPYSLGDTIIFKDNEYIVLEARHGEDSLGKKICNIYIVYNNTNNKNDVVLSILNHSDKIKKKEDIAKKSIDEILDIITIKYGSISKSIDGTNINIPAPIVEQLKYNTSQNLGLDFLNRFKHESTKNREAKNREADRIAKQQLGNKPFENINSSLNKTFKSNITIKPKNKTQIYKVHPEESVLNQHISSTRTEKPTPESKQPISTTKVSVESSPPEKDTKNINKIYKYYTYGNSLLTNNKNKEYRNIINKIMKAYPNYESNKLKSLLVQINQAPKLRKINSNMKAQQKAISNSEAEKAKQKKLDSNINEIIANTQKATTEKEKTNIISRIQQIYANNPRNSMPNTTTSLLNRSKQLLEGK